MHFHVPIGTSKCTAGGQTLKTAGVRPESAPRSTPLKRFSAVLVVFSLLLAPVLAVGAEWFTSPAHGAVKMDCCKNHPEKSSGHRAKGAGAECALCAMECCGVVVPAADSALIPTYAFARLPASAELGRQRREAPPLPPPRNEG